MPKAVPVNTMSFGKRKKAFDAAYSMFEYLINNVEYRAMFIARAKSGELHPTLEKMFFEYILGKPTENVNLNISDNRTDYSKLTEEQILDQKIAMQDRLIQIRAAENTLPNGDTVVN